MRVRFFFSKFGWFVRNLVNYKSLAECFNLNLSSLLVKYKIWWGDIKTYVRISLLLLPFSLIISLFFVLPRSLILVKCQTHLHECFVYVLKKKINCFPNPTKTTKDMNEYFNTIFFCFTKYEDVSNNSQ